MKTPLESNENQTGFTLIEVLITLIVASILGAILIQLMGTNITRSGKALVMAQDRASLISVMEKITAHYKLTAETAAPLANLRTDVKNGNQQGNDPYFGEYTWETKYIAFDPGTNREKSEGEGDTILKITITKDEQTIVALFTK